MWGFKKFENFTIMESEKKEKTSKNETDGIRKGIKTNVAIGVLYSN
jgi:hypothetical protein